MSLLLLLAGLVLTWAGTGGGTKCPDATLLPPCTCAEYDPPQLSCSDVCSMEQLQGVVDRTSDYRLRAIRLLRTDVPYLNASWFAAKQTEELYVGDSTLDSLFSDTETKVQVPSLERLYVDNVRVLRKVQWSDFRVFVWLRRLSITDTEVAELREGFREDVSADLDSLNLSGSKVTSLAGGVLAGKRRLRVVELRHCGITEISNSFFADQRDSLTVLDMSYNPIERLPEDLFRGLQSPKLHLWLVGTRQKTVPDSLKPFLDTHELHLYLEDNPLECFCKMRWVMSNVDRVFGTCDAPPALHSKSLDELTDEDFAAC